MNIHGAHFALRIVLVALALLTMLACGKPLTKAECEQLLARYTDKVIDQARPSTSRMEREELVIEAQKKAQLDPEFAVCSARVSRKKFQCAMEAHNADQIERCLL